MRKSLARLIISITVFSLFFSVNAFAENTMSVSLGRYSVSEGTMTLFADNDLADAEVSYSVSIDGKECQVKDMNTLNGYGMNNSYLFLVDVSGSIKKGMREEMVTFLFDMIDGMSETDNACIEVFGNTVTSADFTNDKQALKNQAENITSNHEDTNLYFAISDGLKLLTDSTNVNEHRCLVVVSDGREDQLGGITRDEVNRSIEEAHIPVYTVVPSNSNASSTKEDATKVLGSFARLSAGGMHQMMGVDNLTAQAAAENILSDVRNSLVLYVDVNEVATDKAEAYLEISASAQGYGKTSSGRTIKASDITNNKRAEVSQMSAQQNTTQAAEDASFSVSDWFICMGILLTVLVIIPSIVVAQKKKKEQRRKALEEANKPVMPVVLPAPDVEKSVTVAPAVQKFPIDDFLPKAEKKPSLEITMTKVGLNEDEVRNITINGSVVVGRTSEKADIVFENDKKVSREHFKFEYDGKSLSIEDMGSSNGTLVNGVPITGKFFIQSDDVVTFGDQEWRINYGK